MAISDCVKCWDTPCTCGYEYMDWAVDRLEQQIAMLQEVLKIKIGAGESRLPKIKTHKFSKLYSDE